MSTRARTAAVLIIAAFAALSAAAAGPPVDAPAKKPAPVIVDLHDGATHLVIEVKAPPVLPSATPDDWVKGQIHNAIFWAGMMRGKPEWTRGADHVCYQQDPPPTTDPSRIPEPVQGGAWDDPAPVVSCSCASPTYNAAKQLVGCAAAGCDGCWICTVHKAMREPVLPIAGASTLPPGEGTICYPWSGAGRPKVIKLPSVDTCDVGGVCFYHCGRE